MNRETSILIVDDERDHADGVAEALEKLNAKAVCVYNAKDAVEILKNQKIDIVVTDLKFDGEIDGLDILNEAQKNNPNSKVILMTAYATIETCKEAIKKGAYDYLVKPIDVGQLRALVEQASKKVSKTLQNAPTIDDRQEFRFEGVRGTGTQIKRLFAVCQRVAATDIAVLIEGESGTGKELLAKAIHNNSKRWDKPFKPINCAGLTESLLESELFGHTKGAFTGATTSRKGLFEQADHGTLFLDEIGDMPFNMQAKLLRVIEDGVVVPVGSSKPTVVDVRIISATNHDLRKLTEQNMFRQDLYFRIKAVSVRIPPLRERTEDIPEFVNFFMKQAVDETGSQINGITDAAMNILMNYSWPGNIRQLRNAIRTMVVMCEKNELDVHQIPPEIHQVRQLTAGREGNLAGVSLSDLEKQAIKDTLEKMKNNREKAAKALGIGERTLYRKIKEYNL